MANNYTEVQLTQNTRISREGQISTVWRVEARTTPHRILFYLEIDDKDMGKENVAKALQTKAAELESVANL